jgi:hypothetical protein
LSGYLLHREPTLLRSWEWRRRWCVVSGSLFVVFEDSTENAKGVLWLLDLGGRGTKEVIVTEARCGGACLPSSMSLFCCV